LQHDFSNVFISYERMVPVWKRAQMVKLSWRVAGSEAGVADAGNEGIQRVTGTVGCIQ
jgi:hypothetical protein